MTFPLVVSLWWPQYRAARVIYLAKWTKNTQWIQEKELLDTKLSFLGEELPYSYW